MGGKVVYLDLILNLDGFKLAVNHLDGDNAPEPVEETRPGIISHIHGVMAILNVLPEPLVNPNNTAFTCLLFIDGELV